MNKPNRKNQTEETRKALKMYNDMVNTGYLVPIGDDMVCFDSVGEMWKCTLRRDDFTFERKADPMAGVGYKSENFVEREMTPKEKYDLGMYSKEFLELCMAYLDEESDEETDTEDEEV